MAAERGEVILLTSHSHDAVELTFIPRPSGPMCWLAGAALSRAICPERSPAKRLTSELRCNRQGRKSRRQRVPDGEKTGHKGPEAEPQGDKL